MPQTVLALRPFWLLPLLLALLGFAAAWRWTPLREWLDVEMLSAYIAAFRGSPTAPLLTLAAFIVGGLVAVPVTLLVVVTVLAFGPWLGFLYALIGAMVSSMMLYTIGRMLGRDTVRRFAGRRLNRLSRRFAERGVLAVALLRMLPVAPFTVINVVAGASHIGLRDFLLGSLLGMGPGMALIALFVDRVGATMENPGLGAALALAALVALTGAGVYALQRWVLRRGKPGVPANAA